MTRILSAAVLIFISSASAAFPPCDTAELQDLGTSTLGERSSAVLDGRVLIMDARTDTSITRNFGLAAVHVDELTSPYGGPMSELSTDAAGAFLAELSPGTHRIQFSRMLGSHEFFVSEKITLRVRAGHRYRAVFMACRH